MSKPWAVYLLQCRSGRLYTGVAVDVQARFALHQAGKGARFTKADPPVALLAYQWLDGRSAALKEEYRIKQLPRAQKLDLIRQWNAT
ncbi:GIY-YIG nuclease family protein [Litorivicinus lipolyticus]|uniref:GIY-YIG nuclease family protein n=1 Tax=Litorivicinus lipolyticus TaxID=418701 RepID=UPI001FE6A79E|nr:GIY-YIG nuclease family protein [Litorivicinus lipolyticus]